MVNGIIEVRMVWMYAVLIVIFKEVVFRPRVNMWWRKRVICIGHITKVDIIKCRFHIVSWMGDVPPS